MLPATEFAPLPILIEFMVASLEVTVNPLPSIFTISVELETKPISPEPLLYIPVSVSVVNVIDGDPVLPEGKVPPAFR